MSLNILVVVRLEWARIDPRITKVEIQKGFGMCSV
jgi:hypothetical protein